MTDKPTPTDAATPECLTCSDHGAVGNILTAEPCPACTRWNVQPAPATQQAREVSDAMVLAALQMQHPAAYGQYLRHPANGPKTSIRTEAEIDTARRMIAAALAAAPQPSPTAQSADSVPAVSDLPPLPAPDLRDVGTKPQEIKEFLKGYATEYARTAIAARAPADSVQEDAACEAIEKVLALFPFNVPTQKFTVNNGPCLTADNDDEFYSVKRVLAFLTEIKTTLDAARKQGGL